MQLLFADEFLTSSLLSILIPIVLLLILAAWYVHQVKRQPGEEPKSLGVAQVSAPGSQTQPGAPGSTGQR